MGCIWHLHVSSLQHWHGVFQKHTNYDDGPSFVTQCPIIPNESFTYDFSVPDQAVFPLVHVERGDKLTASLIQGTLWYHSHYKAQYCDGLRGALIIEDPDDPQKYLYDVDNGEKDIWKDPFTRLRFPPDDTVITLADWYHYLSTDAPAIP
jgi:iron transport multicopper oxidase